MAMETSVHKIGKERAVRKITILSFLGLILFGCSTLSYTDFYSKSDYHQKNRILLSSESPKVYRYTDVRADDQGLMENNYVILGYASFSTPNLSVDALKEQGRKVGATVIMVTSKYAETVSISIPTMTFRPQTSTSSVSGDVNAVVATTKETSEAGYITYRIDRDDYLVTFWAKAKPPVFGAFFTELSLAMQLELNLNKGLLIKAVVDHSPAYEANVIPGDIVIQLNNVNVESVAQFQNLIYQNAGRTVGLRIIRKGEEKNIEVRMNPE